MWPSSKMMISGRRGDQRSVSLKNLGCGVVEEDVPGFLILPTARFRFSSLRRLATSTPFSRFFLSAAAPFQS
jgi:hypothetical protein